MVDSAAGAIKQLTTTIDQWPITVLIVAVCFGIIIVLRSEDRFPNKRILPVICAIAMAMNGALGSVKSVPADQVYPTLVLVFKGLLLGLIACGVYGLVYKLFGKKVSLLSGKMGFGDTIAGWERKDLEEFKNNKPKDK